MPIARISSKRSRMPVLDDVLEVDDAEQPRRARRRPARPPRAACPRSRSPSRPACRARARTRPPVLCTHVGHGGPGALADHPARQVDAAHPGRRGELAPAWRRRAPRPSTGPRPAPGPGRRCCGPPGSRRPGTRAATPRRARSAATPVQRQQLGGPPVAVGDGAGLVEQEHVDVAGRLDRAAGHGQHVAAYQPVHAGDADRREQGADGGRDQADQQGGEHHDRLVGVAVVRERVQRRARRPRR